MFKEYIKEKRIVNYLSYALESMYDISNLKLITKINDNRVIFLISYDIFQNGKSYTLYQEMAKASLIKLVKMGYKLIHQKPLHDLYIYASQNKIKYQGISYINEGISRRRKR